MYIAGRLRTGSSPSRTWMSFAVYVPLAMSVHPRRREGRHLHRRRDRLDGLPLEELAALAAARGDVVARRPDLDPLARRGLEDERLLLGAAGHAHGGDAVALAHLDHRDAAPGVGEHVDLAGLAEENVRLLRRDADDVLVLDGQHGHDLVSLGGAGELAPGARRDLAVRREREA